MVLKLRYMIEIITTLIIPTAFLFNEKIYQEGTNIFRNFIFTEVVINYDKPCLQRFIQKKCVTECRKKSYTYQEAG